ncbi:MAG: gamma-glutamylcyclotransferase family protein [Cyanobacteriota bacterium]|nr:gamma-glutamylcyclotransferase family protein [Cyanobacteriota bacterium]
MAQTGNGADSASLDPGLERLFVYGSLKRGMANHQQLATAVALGAAQLQGLALYDLGPFPMAIASGDRGHTLHGELYGIPALLLPGLDRFEGVPRLYRRVRWPLAGGDRVWVYIGHPRQVRFVPRLEDGQWRPKPRLKVLQQAEGIAEPRCRN